MIPTSAGGSTCGSRCEARALRTSRLRLGRPSRARTHIRTNDSSRSIAAGPAMRTAVSRHGERRRRSTPCFHSFPIPIPPVTPVRAIHHQQLPMVARQDPEPAAQPWRRIEADLHPRLGHRSKEAARGPQSSRPSPRAVARGPRDLAASMSASRNRSPTSSSRKM